MILTLLNHDYVNEYCCVNFVLIHTFRYSSLSAGKRSIKVETGNVIVCQLFDEKGRKKARLEQWFGDDWCLSDVNKIALLLLNYCLILGIFNIFYQHYIILGEIFGNIIDNPNFLLNLPLDWLHVYFFSSQQIIKVIIIYSI